MNVKIFQLTPFYMNCYVLSDGGDAIVIDPGEASPALLDYLSRFNVRMIVNTHCHCDHCGGNAGVKEATGAPLACHELDLPLLCAVGEQGMMFGVPFPDSPDPDQFLAHGDKVAFGGEELQVRHAPGHSPGHVVLAGRDAVFSGDVLFAGSIGRTDLPGGNYTQLIYSIQTQLMSLPDHVTVHSGHGPATTIGVERASNPFLVRS